MLDYFSETHEQLHRKVKYFISMDEDDHEHMIDNLNKKLNELDISPEKIVTIIDRNKYLLVLYHD